MPNLTGLDPEELQALWDYVAEGEDEQSALTRRLWAEYVLLTSNDIGSALLADLRAVKIALVPGAVLERLEEVAHTTRSPSAR